MNEVNHFQEAPKPISESHGKVNNLISDTLARRTKFKTAHR